MPSKILHLRLEAEIIVGCMDASGIDSPTRAVRDCLQYMVTVWKDRKAIPERTPEDIENLLRQETTPGVIPDIPVRDDSDAVEDNRYADLAAQAVKFMEQEGEPDIEEAVSILASTAIANQPKVDLFTVRRKTLSELRELCPKDRILQDLKDENADRLFVTAVEIVYSNLPIDQWGTSAAERLIDDLVKKHLTS